MVGGWLEKCVFFVCLNFSFSVACMVNFGSDFHANVSCVWLPLLTTMIHARAHDARMMNSYRYRDSYWISTLNDVLIFFKWIIFSFFFVCWLVLVLLFTTTLSCPFKSLMVLGFGCFVVIFFICLVIETRRFYEWIWNWSVYKSHCFGYLLIFLKLCFKDRKIFCFNFYRIDFRAQIEEPSLFFWRTPINKWNMIYGKI